LEVVVMELFYSPLACSLASHITIREADIAADFTSVGLFDKKIAGGGDYFAVTSKGQVPALRLDDGTVLTEGPAVMQYIADLKPESGLLPPVGTAERYAVLSWLTYVNTEIHKMCLWPRFNPGPPPEAKAWAKGLLDSKGAAYEEMDVMMDEKKRTEMRERSKRSTVPQIFINGQHIGGSDELAALEHTGKLDPLLAQPG
jgi:glutathione S-transferase